MRKVNWTDLGSANLTYYYNVTVVDYSENFNSTQTRSLKLIDVSTPNLEIVSPYSTEYDFNESIPLDYIVSDLNLDSCWYNLDEGSNITLENCSNVTFNCSDANHTLNLFANDSLGQLSFEQVNFSANSTLVLTNEFKVYRGEVSVDGTAYDTLSEKVNKKKAFILLRARSSDSGPDSLQVISDFVNSTQIQFDNYAAGAGATVEWEVVTGPELNVQRAKHTYLSSDDAFNVSISSVNLSSSFIIVNNRLNDGSGSNNYIGLWTGRFYNSTLIEFQRDGTGIAGEVSWQVVDWQGASVQSGNSSLSSTLSSVDFSNEVDLSKSFLIFSRRSTINTLESSNIGGYFRNGTQLGFYRVGSSGITSTEWFVVEWYRFDVQYGTFNVQSNSAPVNVLIDELGSLNKSFHTHSRSSTGSGTTYANSFATTELTSTTNLQAISATTATNTKNISWYVIEIKSIQDLNVSKIEFNSSSALEGENVTVSVYVNNSGMLDADNVSVLLNISLWNGSVWQLNEQQQTTAKVDADSGTVINFSWIASSGTHKFSVFADSNYSYPETNELDNFYDIEYTVSGWGVFYGHTNGTFVIADNPANNFSAWIPSTIQGNLFFVDADSSIDFTQLKPLNESDDLLQADSALNSSGFNDSIKNVFDINDDLIPDNLGSFVIYGETINNVPYVESTNTSSFLTAILWDSSDGGIEYNGSQDLVFMTVINDSKSGKYGTYDYEIRLPGNLDNYLGANDWLVAYMELIS